MRTSSMLLVLLLAGAVLSAPSSSRQVALINAFSDRKTVESIVDCFLGKKKCSPEEEKMRVRALATMRNFGSCPSNLCTPEEAAEMSTAMGLLADKYPDLWAKLIAAMFGIDLGRK
ncbi:uncharacterized protein LOC125036685 [Penaeus chinensis]|uniref:uncharacterized protein LOC125036685 n=1 Tax=Penaeus chinensis TaxID=139456 RepID=UPI001FB6416F|nr:uncharacterized protein LOC125036685 [Penaeus chinensis]